MNKITSKEVENDERVTMKQMCEHIVKAEMLYKRSSDDLLTAEEIYNYSPTGELFMVFQWYRMACNILGYTASQNQN